MELALNEVANPPPIQRTELSSSSNTSTTNSNNNGLQQTLESLLLRISNMKTSINDQTRQLQIHPEALPSRSDTVREQYHLSPHAPVDQKLSGGNLNTSIEKLESCNSENRHAANQVSSG